MQTLYVRLEELCHLANLIDAEIFHQVTYLWIGAFLFTAEIPLRAKKLTEALRVTSISAEIHFEDSCGISMMNRPCSGLLRSSEFYTFWLAKMIRTLNKAHIDIVRHH